LPEFTDRVESSTGAPSEIIIRIRRFSGRGAVETARLDSGEMLDVDLVVVTTGAIPNDEIATAAGITTDDGIIVDATGHSTTPDVYAAGDCARFFSAHYGREIRLESVQNAIDQAKVAAAGMLGRTVQYDPVPCFSSQQYDVTLRIAGLSQYHDETHVVGSRESGKFAVYYLHEGRLFAVDAVNDEKAHLAAIKQIGKEWAPAEA